MAVYNKSQATKQHIINVARQLFWEKGYVNTYYKDLERFGGINPGLIHYHFKNKETLGWMVYSQLIDESIALGELLATEGTKLLTKCCINIILCWHWTEISPEYARFSYEAARERIPAQAAQNEDIYRFGELLEGKVDERTLRILNRLAVSSENELFLALMEGFEDITPMECAYMDVRNCSSAVFSQEEIDEEFANALKILEQYEFTVSQGFELHYRKK